MSASLSPHMCLPSTLSLQGAWNLIDVRFAACARMDTWAVASLLSKEDAEYENPLSVFMKDLYDMLMKCGLTVRNLGRGAFW